MSRYRHWVNPEGPLVFLTSSTGGFATVFEWPAVRGLVASILDAHCFYGARLHAYCVMPHHVHFVSWIPQGRTASWFMNRIKSNAAKRVLPLLGPHEIRILNEGSEPGRVLWQRSYRRTGLTCGRSFFACVRYVHLNPLRGGLCTDPLDYRWSSAFLWQECRWDPQKGLPISDDLLREYCDPSQLRFGPQPEAG
ncbi:MAG TPA: transposase [Fimbriimonadaceae bacterium]|nr:transposase [Fimbriimonadaceae bacterium]